MLRFVDNPQFQDIPTDPELILRAYDAEVFSPCTPSPDAPPPPNDDALKPGGITITNADGSRVFIATKVIFIQECLEENELTVRLEGDDHFGQRITFDSRESMTKALGELQAYNDRLPE